MSDCKKCGKCCEYVAVSFNFGTVKMETMQIIETRGIIADVKEQCILIPSDCPQLLPPNENGERLCKIYGKPERPYLCTIAQEQPYFWTPKDCGFKQRHKRTGK